MAHQLITHIIEYASKDSVKATKDYLNREEKTTLVKLCGLDGFFLFDHYLSKAHVPNPDLSDDYIASLLDCGWSARKVQTVRLKLVKAGWMDTVQYTKQATGQKFTKTLLGPTVVELNKQEVHRKQMEPVILANRDIITKQLGYSNWEEVVANEDHSKILEMFDAITLEGEAK